MKLYVDGNLVAANANVTKAQVYRGYWRVGGDRLVVVAVGADPGSDHREPRRDRGVPDGAVASVTSGRTTWPAAARHVFPNIPPTASFTSIDALPDGDVRRRARRPTTTARSRRYAWNFGDGDTGHRRRRPSTPTRPAAPTHVTLTVTDNRGGTTSVTNDVTVVDPPPNVLPVAVVHDGHHRTARRRSPRRPPTRTARSSSSAWDFGDSTTGTRRDAAAHVRGGRHLPRHAHGHRQPRRHRHASRGR